MARLSRILRRLFRICLAVYLGLLILVYLGQRSFIYHPEIAALKDISATAGRHGFEPWKNAAGQYIGWKQIGAGNIRQRRILIVHGNSGSAIDRLDYADGLKSTGPLDIYILEYPGFGAREGSPSQASFFHAADEAVTLLKKAGPFYVMGESLGTGVAAYIAGHPS